MHSAKRIAWAIGLGLALIFGLNLIAPGKEESKTMEPHAHYVTLTESNFQQEVLESKQPVLVDFWATWCAPCRVIEPVVEELAANFKGRAKVAKLDVDTGTGLAAQYGVQAIPTLLLFKDGRIADRVVGVVPKEVLVKKLEDLLDGVRQ